MAFRIRKPSQESFFALNAIPLYSYAIPLTRAGWGLQQNVMVDLRDADRTLSPQAMPLHCPGAKRSGAAAPWPLERSSGVALKVWPCAWWSRPPLAHTL